MKSDEKPRHEVSEALIALRRAMGKTQQEFAVHVLDCAISTLARYETSTPPRGEVLLRLAEIAEGAIREYRSEQGKLLQLHNDFRGFYIEEVLASLGGVQLLTAPKTETRAAHGYLLTRLEGPDQIIAAHSFIRIMSALRSTDPKVLKAARSAVLALSKAADHCSPMTEIEHALLAYACAPQEPAQ